MPLELQQYDMSLTYQKGTDMHVADSLSKTSVHVNHTVSEQSSFEELETVCAVETGLPDKQLEVIYVETVKDTTLQTLAQIVDNEWLADRNAVPKLVKQHFIIRNEIVTDNKLLFNRNRCIIPTMLRK